MKQFIKSKLSKVIYFSVLFCIAFTLSACSASTVKRNDIQEQSTEETLELEVPTPSDQIEIVKAKVMDEMRIFDVNAHHEALYNEIKQLPSSLDNEQLKGKISDIVIPYMDAYFYQVISDLLVQYNDKYMTSEVETIFDSTSRTALYELIVLYEYTFYKNEH